MAQPSELEAYLAEVARFNPENRDEFARLLKLGRALTGDTIYYLAPVFVTAPGSISRWEQGYSCPPEEARLIIVRYFRDKIMRTSFKEVL